MRNVAEIVFLEHLSIMKSILDLGEYGLRDDAKAYKYFKGQTMNAFYNGLRKTFQELERDDILVRCDCKGNMRTGYTNCASCHGAGYRNAKESAPENETSK